MSTSYEPRGVPSTARQSFWYRVGYRCGYAAGRLSVLISWRLRGRR